MPDSSTWTLESFIDSLIVELDRAQDTLAVKGVNRPLTYTVRDVALELQIFPKFKGDSILFSAARPGETGASKVSIQLGSITDRQIKEVTKTPMGKDEVAIDLIEDIDPETRTTLRKIGVTSTKDLERMEDRDVDIEKVSKKKVDYRKLASVIGKAYKRKTAPTVNKVSVAKASDGLLLTVLGTNLIEGGEHPDFPVALLNEQEVRVVSARPDQLDIEVRPQQIRRGSNSLAVALDRFSIIRLNLQH